MTALSADRNTPQQDGNKQGYPVAAGAVIYTGALVGINAGGYAVPMSLATGLACVGVAEFQCSNVGGAAGALTVIAQRKKCWHTYVVFCGGHLQPDHTGPTPILLDPHVGPFVNDVFWKRCHQ